MKASHVAIHGCFFVLYHLLTTFLVIFAAKELTINNMGVIDNIRNMLYGTQYVMQQQIMNGRTSFNGYDRAAIASLFYDKSKANFAVYSVINYCADAVADTLRRAKIIDKDGNEVTNHWSYDVFFNPNKFMQPKDFYYAYAVNRLLFGDAFIYLLKRVGITQGQIKEMFVAHSQDVVIGTGAVNYDWTEPQKIYKIPIKGLIREFNFDEILRVYSYNVDNSSDYGLSPLIPAAILAEKLLNASAAEVSSFKNGGVETLLANKQSIEGQTISLSQPDLDSINKTLNDPNGKRVRVLNSNMEKIEIGKSPVDLGVLQSSDAAMKALMFVYKLPYSLFSGDGTFNNTKEGYRALYTQVGLPYAYEFLDKFTKVCGFENGEYWTIDEQLIPQLKEDADKVITTLSKAYATTNEIRAAAGLKPLKGDEYDKPLYPMNINAGLDNIDVNNPI